MLVMTREWSKRRQRGFDEESAPARRCSGGKKTASANAIPHRRNRLG